MPFTATIASAKRYRVGLFAALAATCLGCAGRAEPADRGQVLVADGWVEVPFSKGSDTIPVVDGEIAGESLHLVLDTGAATLAIDQAVATRLKLEVGAADKRAVGVGAGAPIRSVKLPKLRLGRLDTTPARAVVLDLDAVNMSRSRRGDPPVDGVLGADFLDAHRAVIDFAAGRLYLRPRAAGG
jgi:predicted aspartyl protease